MRVTRNELLLSGDFTNYSENWRPGKVVSVMAILRAEHSDGQPVN